MSAESVEREVPVAAPGVSGEVVVEVVEVVEVVKTPPPKKRKKPRKKELPWEEEQRLRWARDRALRQLRPALPVDLERRRVVRRIRHEREGDDGTGALLDEIEDALREASEEGAFGDPGPMELRLEKGKDEQTGDLLDQVEAMGRRRSRDREW